MGVLLSLRFDEGKGPRRLPVFWIRHAGPRAVESPKILMSSLLNDFIESAHAVIREFQTPREVVARIEPLLGALVRDRSWLDTRYRKPLPHKAYAQYLLHRPTDHAFSVVAFVWNPSQGSPVHDHCTWGVVGQYEGEEEETRYRWEGDRLAPARVLVAKPGDTSHVYPPDRDIHRIFNRSAAPTISVHIYGGDIGSQPRHVYDLPTGRRTPFISGYDALPP